MTTGEAGECPQTGCANNVAALLRPLMQAEMLA